VERVTLFCFAASYGAAFLLDLLYQSRPRPVVRLLGVGFGAAGLLAHTIYLAVQRPALAWQFGWMLFLAWILAIFYLYGTLHHRRRAWGVFVLPLVLGLVGLAAAFGRPPDDPGEVVSGGLTPRGDRFWGLLHAALLLLAAVGMCVGFLASLMYLFQARQLRAKVPPGRGLRLLSLERLEQMNRRAVALAFPLLTVGILLGAALMGRDADRLLGWADPRVLSTVALWVVFALMFSVRYGYHLRGRQVALLTIAAFVMLLGCLTLSHPIGQAVAGGVAR
jgi:ABC-type transport system involved in cytochrome c biogenesis permease subunit